MRGEILVEDDVYRKTGLHMVAWRETGRCVLYQMQGVVTTRGYACSKQQGYRPRFTLGQLEVLFDEVWEDELEVGPRVELADAFRPHAAKVLELDAKGDFERCLQDNRHKGLCDLVRRYYGWVKPATGTTRPRRSVGS